MLIPVISFARDYSFLNIGVDRGLSHSNVTSIQQDSLGFMWFSTNDGLNCFDGTSIRVYKHEQGNANSLPSNIVNKVYVDRDGTVWACTANGLARFNSDLSRFERIDLGSAIVSVENLIQFDRDAFIVATRNSTFIYTASSGTVDEFLFEGKHFATYSGQSFGNDLVLVSTVRGGGLSRRYLMHYCVLENKLNERYKPIELGRHCTSIATAEGADNFIVSTNSGELLYVNTRVGSIRRSDVESSAIIASLATDLEGGLWIGQQENVSIIDRNGKVNRINVDSRVNCIYVDRRGGVWLGTEYSGVLYWDLLRGRFETIPGLKDGIATGIAVASDGTIWVGTNNSGVFRLDHNGGIHNYRVGSVRDIREIDGKIYVCSNSTGVFEIDGNSCRNVVPHPQEVNSIIRANDGKMWIGSLVGLFLFNPQTGSMIRYNTQKLMRVTTMFFDLKGQLWVGTKESLEVFKVDADNSLTPVTPDDLGPNVVQAQTVFQSKDGIIWIGCDSGLFQYSSNGLHFAGVNGVVRGIEQDGRGNFWISTDSGLCRYDPEIGTKRFFLKGDGLPGDQYNTYSHACDLNGTMYFGGIEGVVKFNPLRISDNCETVPPFISKLSVYSKEVLPGDETGILEKDIIWTESLKLKHSQTSIALHFCCPDYFSSGNNRFAYKMKGLDEKWTETGGRTAVYSSLPRGKYQFMVKVANSDGVWCKKPDTLSIRVFAVWYKSWVLISVYILLAVLAIVYGLVRVIRKNNAVNAVKMAALQKKYEEQLRKSRLASVMIPGVTIKPRDEDLILKVLETVNDKMENASFSVEDLANEMCMTRSNLHLRLKSCCRYTPVELIRKARIEKACSLIEKGEKSLTEISELCGYNSVTYFNTAFKSVMGTTPGRYMASLK